MICSVCKTKKTSDNFKKGRQCNTCVKVWHANNFQHNKERMMRANREWRKNNKDREYEYNLKSRLKTKYGLTVEQYNVILTNQNGVCAVCLSTHSKRKGSKGLFVDHCHTTGKVRGLLCHFCNLAAGWVQDNPNLIDKLKKHVTKT